MGCASAVYRMWAEQGAWATNDPLEQECETTDEALLNGASVRAAGRSPAVDYWDARATPNHHVHIIDDDLVVVAVASLARELVNAEVATTGARLLFAGGLELEEQLVAAGILQRVVEGTAAHLSFRLSAYNVHYGKLKYVVVPRRSAHPSGFAGCLCTCLAFGLHARCEHVYFVQAMDVPTRASTRNLHEEPRERPRGRPLGSSRTVQGKARPKGAPKPTTAKTPEEW